MSKFRSGSYQTPKTKLLHQGPLLDVVLVPNELCSGYLWWECDLTLTSRPVGSLCSVCEAVLCFPSVSDAENHPSYQLVLRAAEQFFSQECSPGFTLPTSGFFLTNERWEHCHLVCTDAFSFLLIQIYKLIYWFGSEQMNWSWVQELKLQWERFSVIQDHGYDAGAFFHLYSPLLAWP